MSKKIDELLAVLDMPERVQAQAIYRLGYCKEFIRDFGDGYMVNWKIPKEVIAFRLRDEVTKPMPLVLDKDNVWYKAVRIVVSKVLEDNTECDILELLGWLANFGEPIHIIITALKAKQIAKENNDTLSKT